MQQAAAHLTVRVSSVVGQQDCSLRHRNRSPCARCMATLPEAARAERPCSPIASGIDLVVIGWGLREEHFTTLDLASVEQDTLLRFPLRFRHLTFEHS
jgi:hypothetical protein